MNIKLTDKELGLLCIWVGILLIGGWFAGLIVLGYGLWLYLSSDDERKEDS